MRPGRFPLDARVDYQVIEAMRTVGKEESQAL